MIENPAISCWIFFGVDAPLSIQLRIFGRVYAFNNSQYVHGPFGSVIVTVGYGQTVEDPAEMSKALERAIKVIEGEKRQALLNVICRGP